MGKQVRYLYAVVVMVLCMAVCCSNSFSLSGQAREEDSYGAGESVVAPEFALDDLNDRVFTLSEYRDRKPVILFFWTTWCSNCREGMRVLNEMYPEIVKDNFEVLSINVGESKSKVARFAQARNFRFKVLLDPSTGTARSFSLVGVPTYVIIDKKGFVRFYDHFFPRDDFKRLVED